MKKSKKIILSIISLLIIVLIAFTYKTYRSKTFNGGNLGNLINATKRDEINIDASEKCLLLSVNIELVSGELEENDKGISATTLDELKKLDNFKKSDNSGSIEVNILDDDNNVIDAFSIESGQDKTHYKLLKSGHKYKVKIKSEKFNGWYESKYFQYEVL